MDDLELLGSRYLKPEQVVPGPVQTFRTQNAATLREVFIHRVSTTEEAIEQGDLLKLLTTALVRSAEAKRLVLDFGEEQGYWNVITECEPQCEHLREWLQSEVDAAHKGAGMLTAEQAAAMGEFARLFARGVPPPLTASRRLAAAPVAASPPVAFEEAVVEPVAPPPAIAAVPIPAPDPPVQPLTMAATQSMGDFSRPVEQSTAQAKAQTMLETAASALPSAIADKPRVVAAPAVEVMKETPLIFPPRESEVRESQVIEMASEDIPIPVFATALPKPAPNKKLVTFFVILLLLAAGLIFVIFYLSMHP